MTLACVLIAVPVGLFVYAYLVYPALLQLFGALKPAPKTWGDPPEWPMITILIPAYNEEESLAETCEAILALDYPADRRQIVVMSDASTDRTDEIAQSFAGRGVELLRLPQRGGKTALENAVLPMVRGKIVVNTDATIRIPPHALKPLIRVFQDPTIGVASGRDVSVGDLGREGNRHESSYVGYEMWVRALETRMGSIVGASGCFYAVRRELVDSLFPEALSRDFASVLRARRLGFRAVSVNDAICAVARTRSLRAEYRRKIRTMARGLETLWFMRSVLDPFRHGTFAWMLFSHKLARWLVWLTLPGVPLGLVLLAPSSPVAAWALAAQLAGAGLGLVALRWPEHRPVPPLLGFFGFALASSTAGFVAWIKALRGELNPTWEPTRRPGVKAAVGTIGTAGKP
ncbi:MAG: glycosyltransferase family 2 protein [Gemmatimonadota bacterium]